MKEENMKQPIHETPQPQEDAVPLPPKTLSSEQSLLSKNAHTYAEDMAKALRENSGSMISIAVAEHKRKEDEAKRLNPRTKKNRFFILTSTVLIIVSCLVGIFAVQEFKTKSINVQQSQKIYALLPVDEAHELPVDSMQKYDISLELQKLFSKVSPGKNSIAYIAPTQEGSAGRILVSTSDFLGIMRMGAPENILRVLDDTILLGVYEDKKSTYPFILLRNTSFFTQFSNGMRVWEEGMLDDLFIAFTIDVFGNNAYLFEQKFKDTIVQNFPARALNDKEGKRLLFYTFLNDEILYISPYSEPIPEILRRLTLSK